MSRFEKHHRRWLLLILPVLLLLYLTLPRIFDAPDDEPPSATPKLSSAEKRVRRVSLEPPELEPPKLPDTAAPEEKPPTPTRVRRPEEPGVTVYPPPVRVGPSAPGFPFLEGETITYDEIGKLEDYLPPEFWKHRDYFFYEGMELEIGPFYRDYGEPPVFHNATREFQSEVSLGKDGALVGYGAGRPFPQEIDCADPEAGLKIIWNLMKRWEGDGSAARYFYSYWDRGEQLPLYYEGTSKGIQLSNRAEPHYLASGGDIFKNEKRLAAFGIEVEAPFDVRGRLVMTYRYKAADAPLDRTKNDDTWVYFPDLRRVRRISRAQRTEPVSGTDFTFDDLLSFRGIPPQYNWVCLGEQDLLAPMNSRVLGYPYDEDHNFGPYGLSYANDRWELRLAYIVRFDPGNADHPYAYKDFWIDSQTYEPLYSFAYDRKKELWKIIWHNHRWSEDWHEGDPRSKDGDWYKGWESVPEPRDLRVVSDVILNVQTGTGTRIEFWDNHGTPFPTKGKIRRYIDIGRLNKGR
jgi:hypothetical protein